MSSNEQFLRKAFDAAYEVPDALRRLNQETRRSTKIIIASVILAVLWFLLVVTVSPVVLTEIERANRPPVENQLAAPYGLAERTSPDSTNLVFDDTIAFTQAEYDTIQQTLAEELMAADGVQLPEDNDPAQMVAVEATAEPTADGANPEATPEPAADPATLESYMQTVAIESIIPNMKAYTADPLAYFQVMPTLNMYERQFASELVAHHDTFGCLFTLEHITACGIEDAPIFIEAAQYHSTDDLNFQVSSVRYADADTAYAVMRQLHNHSNSVGTLGNFSLIPGRATNYYNASQTDQHLLVWSHDEWIFALNVSSLQTIEDIVKLFYF